MASTDNGSDLGIEASLFKTADKLRGNMEPSDYKHVALGLIFLKHISDSFELKRQQLLTEYPDIAELIPALRQISATVVPSSPCLILNAFCASVNFNAFMLPAPLPARENLAENSTRERGRFRGSHHTLTPIGPSLVLGRTSGADSRKRCLL